MYTEYFIPEMKHIQRTCSVLGVKHSNSSINLLKDKKDMINAPLLNIF